MRFERLARPHQRKVVTAPERILDIHRAGPRHRALPSRSDRVIDRAGSGENRHLGRLVGCLQAMAGWARSRAWTRTVKCSGVAANTARSLQSTDRSKNRRAVQSVASRVAGATIVCLTPSEYRANTLPNAPSRFLSSAPDRLADRHYIAAANPIAGYPPLTPVRAGVHPSPFVEFKTGNRWGSHSDRARSRRRAFPAWRSSSPSRWPVRATSSHRFPATDGGIKRDAPGPHMHSGK